MVIWRNKIRTDFPSFLTRSTVVVTGSVYNHVVFGKVCHTIIITLHLNEKVRYNSAKLGSMFWYLRSLLPLLLKTPLLSEAEVRSQDQRTKTNSRRHRSIYISYPPCRFILVHKFGSRAVGGGGGLGRVNHIWLNLQTLLGQPTDIFCSTSVRDYKNYRITPQLPIS